MSENEADSHHEKALKEGRIITICDGDILAGYVEFSFTNGVCFINDLFIRPIYRNSRAIWKMKRRLLEICKGAKILLGERNKFGKRFPEFKLRRG